MNKYIYLTDTHFNNVLPWTLAKFLLHLRRANPSGIFLTGDIANGILTPSYLKLLAKTVSCPIYFIMGNHDFFFSSLEKTYVKIRKLCKEYSNLIWLTESDIIALNNEVALIGTDGWYDCANGKPEYLKFTFDWFMIEDFRNLSSMKERIKFWQKLADKSAQDISNKLEKAIHQGYKNIYILTHVPPFAQATRDVGTFLEPFWLPYNTNIRLGNAIKDIMKEHKKKNVILYSGHTHCPTSIQVSRNIFCNVGTAHYVGLFKINEQTIYI